MHSFDQSGLVCGTCISTPSTSPPVAPTVHYCPIPSTWLPGLTRPTRFRPLRSPYLARSRSICFWGRRVPLLPALFLVRAHPSLSSTSAVPRTPCATSRACLCGVVVLATHVRSQGLDLRVPMPCIAHVHQKRKIAHACSSLPSTELWRPRSRYKFCKGTCL